MTDKLRTTIEKHKKMWEFIKEQEKDCGYIPNVENRFALKSNYLYNYTVDVEPLNNCYLCEYARRAFINSSADCMCDCCPCLWGSENERYGFYCEPDEGESGVCWATSPVDDIINLPIKPELL